MISKCLWFNGQCGVDSYSNLVSSGVGMNVDSKSIMHIQNHIRNRTVLSAASLVLVFASWLPHQVIADELKEAKVTQVIRDVRVLPSNASPRPATVNDNVREGTAVQTGVQSRSELTFKDQTITRLGEQTIFSVGEGARTIDLGSGQFLLCVPKKAGGTKVKAGAVTAAITG
jgi:FecR-like protein